MSQRILSEKKQQKNYKLTISYDGSRYYGWEHQPGKDTIQGKLENVLMRMCGMDEIPEVIGAGRTDAGVHAKAMVASVLLDTELSPREIRAYMNRYLPDDISIVDVREASERFHARYNAVGKTYSYTCYVGEGKPIFQRKYVTRLEDEPDMDAMLEAASYLQGEHDFKSFCGNPKMKKSTVRLVDTITIKRSKNQIYFTFHGTGFLQHMVRILVGTLLEVGYGRMSPTDMPALLEARDRSKAGPTAPACGLCLERVEY
jgi:tRNA pseudouridine38-40 synthase